MNVFLRQDIPRRGHIGMTGYMSCTLVIVRISSVSALVLLLEFVICPMLSDGFPLVSCSASVKQFPSAKAFALIHQCRVVIVRITECQHLWNDERGFYPGCNELLCCHSVVLEKAKNSEWKCSYYTEPAGGLSPNDGIETKIDTNRYAACQDRKKELPQ